MIKDRDEMIAAMDPIEREGIWHYCRTQDVEVVHSALPRAFAFIREEDGFTLVLEDALAAELGFERTAPMRLITLQVFSALDGYGLTAAFSAALADAQISCNVIAAFDHDHLLVPVDRAPDAMTTLRLLQQRTNR